MRKRAKIMWWLLSLTLSIVLILPITLYLLSPIIAQKGLEHWLKKQNFSHVELVMQPPTWDTLQIEKLSLQKTQTDKQLSVSTENILIRFNPIDLYLHQRLSLVQLPQSNITITYTGESIASDDSHELIDLSNLLPQQWFKKIPIDLIQIGELNLNLDYPADTVDWRFSGALLFDGEQLYSRVKFYRDNTDLGWGDLKLSYDNHFYLRLLESDKPFFTIDGVLSYTEQLQLDSQQHIDIAGLNRWGVTLLPELVNNIQITPSLDIQGQLKTQGSTLFPLRTQLTPDALLGSIKTQQKINATVDIQSPLPEIKQLTASVTGNVDFSLSHLSAVIDPTSTITAKHLMHNNLKKSTEKLDIQFKKSIKIGLDLSENTPSIPDISPLSIRINTTTVYLPEIEILPLQVDLDLQAINLENNTIKGQVDIKEVGITHQQKSQPTFNLANAFTLSKERIDNQFNLSSNDLPFSLTGRTTTNTATLTSDFNWELQPLNLSNISKPIRKYFTIPPQLNLTAGTFFHNGSGHLKNNKLSIVAHNSIQQASLGWDETLIEQLNIDSKTTFSSTGQFTDTGTIKLGKVTKGIEITKVSTNYSYKKDSSKGRDLISLKALQADILGGQIKISDVEFDPLNPNLSTNVDIEKLDLGDVLKLEQQQGLSGEGKLSGHFPLQYKDGEASIKNGKLLSLAPGGRIVFLPSSAVAAYAETNIGLKTAIEALENFHFELLNIQLNYEPDGTALLTTRLKGNNPDWHNGHPIDFTINVEENIPQLLKTLQFADKLTRTIEERYR